MNKKNEKKQSILWLKFWIYWRLPIGIFIGVAYLFAAYNEIEFWNYLTKLCFILDLLTILIYMLTFFTANKFMKIGFYFLNISLLVECFYSAFKLTYEKIGEITNDFLTILILYLGIEIIIWFLPNFVYLRKRKILFTHEFLKNEKIKFCKVCGEKLNRNYKCSKCGKQYFNIKLITQKKEIIISILTFFILFLIFLNLYQLFIINNEKINTERQIAELEKEIEDIKSQSGECRLDRLKYKNKADFLDKNIVFVIKDYGNYYYTYDCVQKITSGSYTYWAYNKEAAISKGYKKGTC